MECPTRSMLGPHSYSIPYPLADSDGKVLPFTFQVLRGPKATRLRGWSLAHHLPVVVSHKTAHCCFLPTPIVCNCHAYDDSQCKNITIGGPLRIGRRAKKPRNLRICLIVAQCKEIRNGGCANFSFQLKRHRCWQSNRQIKQVTNCVPRDWSSFVLYVVCWPADRVRFTCAGRQGSE